MVSVCCLYDSPMNHPTPSAEAVSNAATQEILPTPDVETSTNSSMFFMGREF